MPELFFDIRFNANESDLKTVKDEANRIQKEVNDSVKGASESTEKQTAAEEKLIKSKKEKLKTLIREKNIAEANFRLGNMTQEQLEQTTADIFRQANAQELLGTEVDATGTKYKQLAQAQVRASTGFKGIGQESARANQSLMNLGRIVQDLPFGFLGISNNIDPALTSFKKLREDAGGTGGALKALLGSLKGSGGLIFALGSLLPTAVLIAQKGFNMYSKKTKKATDSNDEFLQSLNRLRETSEFSFLGKSGIESEIRSLEEIKFITDEILRLSEVADNKGRSGNPELATKAEIELDRLADVWGISAEKAQEYTDKLESLNKQLSELEGRRATSELGMFREEVEQTATAALDLVETTGKNQNAVKDLAEQYFTQAKALTSVIDTNEDARIKYNLLVETARDLMSSYDGYADAVDSSSLAQDEATKKTKEAEQALKDLYKLSENPPDVEVNNIQEERALQRALVLQSLKRENEINAAQGLTQELLQIESNFQQRRLDLRMRGLLDENIVRELEIERNRQKESAITANEEAGIKRRFELRQAYAKQEKQLEQSLARSKVQINQAAFSALASLSQGFANDNKKLAIALLSIEKGLAIAEVVVSGIKEASKATAVGLGYLVSPFTAPLAKNAFAQAASIKTNTAINAALIAAQGLGEAVSISNRGSRTSSTSSIGSSQKESQGFFTTTEEPVTQSSEPRRPTQDNQPIILRGDIADDEIIAVRAEKGRQSILRGTVFINSTS